MTENITKPEMSRLEVVEKNLKDALNAWTEEIVVSELPIVMQRKHRVVLDKITKLMFDVHKYRTTERRVGRPRGGLTKTLVRNEIKNATPEQLAAIAKILGKNPETETEISTVSANVEDVAEVNENE